MVLALAAELDDINDQFQAAIDALEGTLKTGGPDIAELARRRAALARVASARLRMIDQKLCPLLESGPTPQHAAAARHLRDRIAAIFAASNQHIGDWSSQRVVADWNGYCAATRSLASDVKSLLAMERRDIYPLLATAA
ncbi:MAG: hypothetical protein V4459_15565 [Pseudomonadota bacterium]